MIACVAIIAIGLNAVGIANNIETKGNTGK